MSRERMTPADLTQFLRAHDCFRRDLVRIRDLLASADELGPARAQALAEHWAALVALLEHHHHTEDDVILPTLMVREPTVARPVSALRDEHVALDTLLAEAAPLVAAVTSGRGDREAAADCVARLERLVATHLDTEERDMVPLFLTRLTQSEWARIEEQTTAALIRDGLLAFALPWAAEGMDASAMASGLATLPPPVRTAYQHEWQPRYEERSRLLFAGSHAR